MNRPHRAPHGAVPIATIRAHIRTCLTAGMRIQDVAADAHMNPGALTKITYWPQQKWCTGATATAILAVHPRNGDRFVVDATGVHRRIKALARIGWPISTQAEMAGFDRTSASHWLLRPRIIRVTHDAVAGLYDRLQTQDGPSRRASARAVGKGWYGPEAWADHTIDDPAAEPYSWCRDDVDEIALLQVEQGMRRFRDLTEPERQALLRRHHGRMSQKAMIQTWQVDRRTLTTYGAKLGLGSAAAVAA